MSEVVVARDADEIIVSFTDGTPTAIDGRAVTMLEAVQELNTRAGAQGVGCGRQADRFGHRCHNVVRIRRLGPSCALRTGSRVIQ